MYHWTCGSGRITLQFTTLEECEACAHPGPCDADVRALSHTPSIAAQLAAIDPANLRRELRDYGAWNATELEDHAQNLQRLLWIASNDVAEDPSTYTD